MKSKYVFGLLLVLTACIRPNYQKQYVDVPCEWRLETDEGSTLCNYRWWEQFNDPVLNDLIIIALQNNQDLKLAISRVFEYYDRLGITNAAMYPQVNANGAFSRTRNSTTLPTPNAPGIGPIFNDYLAFLDLSWELDFWGRLHSASDAAYADLLGQVEARRAIVMTVVSSVANAYIELRTLDAQLHDSRKTLATRQEALKLAQDRFNLGETSELEVKQAESEVENAAIRAIQFERDIPISENRISILLGQNPRVIERGETLDMFHYPITIPAGLSSDLLTRRPDIVQAEDQLIAVNARVAEARALYFPQISLTGFYGSQSTKLRDFLTGPSRMWSYGMDGTQIVFDAGRTVYTVAALKSLRDEALYNYRQVILNAFREVDDALIRYQKNRELVVENQKQVHVLRDYLHLAKLRYNEGEVDYLNVLDAERQLFDAQLELAQAKSDSFTAVVGLYKALGGGWVIDADDIALSQ